MAARSEATFWYVLPSLPMLLVIPALLRHGVGFWAALAARCALTIGLYDRLGGVTSRLAAVSCPGPAAMGCDVTAQVAAR